MTPKEKAKQLAERFNYKLYEAIIDPIVRTYEAKQCALIAVDEILNALDSKKIIYGSEYRFKENIYWEQVKKEIENL